MAVLSVETCNLDSKSSMRRHNGFKKSKNKENGSEYALAGIIGLNSLPNISHVHI